MNTLVRTYRLLLVLASGFLVLAMQVPVPSSAFARGSAPGSVHHAFYDLFAPFSTSSHDSTVWAGNFATGARRTYQEVTVNFRVPTIEGPASQDGVAFWAGLGGVPQYGGSGSTELVQAGITSYMNANDQQTNYAWYEYVGDNGKITPQRVPFAQGLHHGDMIYVNVAVNYQTGEDSFTFYNQATGETPTAVNIHGPLPDGATGECIGEHSTNAPDIADFNAPQNTEWLNNCTITNTAQTAKPIGAWPHNWYRLVNGLDQPLIGVGAIDSNGSYTLNYLASA